MTNLTGMTIMGGILAVLFVWIGSVVLLRLLFWILRKTERKEHNGIRIRS